MLKVVRESEISPLGVGCYTAPEAARLLKTSARTISRWLGGYDYRGSKGQTVHSAPLWTPQWPREGESIELGFRDLIELRLVLAFASRGIPLTVIRRCQENARELFADERPFAKHRFRTDGRSIFIESVRDVAEAADSGAKTSLTDLKTNQLVFKEVIEQTFRDLDLDDGAVAQWRPYGGKPSIVVDPARSFGKPLATNFGVPTSALASAVLAEGSVKQVARLFDVPTPVVNDAVAFERSLMAA